MKMKYRTYRTLKRAGIYVALGALTFIAVSPIFWMGLSSIRHLSEVFQVPPKIIPTSLDLTGYQEVFLYTPFIQCLINSTFVGLVATAASIAIGAAGAYSITRWQKRYSKFISQSVLISYMIPPILLVIPYFILLKRVGLVDTLSGLILTHVSFALPFATWLLTAYFSTLPRELEEAARIDGCTNFGAFIRIILPLSVPGIVAVAIFTFINSWNEFVYALLLVTSAEKRTITAGFYSLMGAEVLQWEPMIAWIVLITIPPLIFFVLIQQKLVKGLAAGAVKR